MLARARLTAFMAFCGLLLPYADASAQWGLDSQVSQSALVEVRLIADVEAVAPGDHFRLGVLFEILDTWHVNWSNPGDAGLAPSIGWKLPQGWQAGVLQWPHPERFQTAGPLELFGYEGKVLLFTDVSVPEDVTPGSTVVLAADVSWLACQDACVPGEGNGSLRMAIEGTRRPSASVDTFARAAALVPARPEAWRFDAWIDGEDHVQIDIANARDNHQLSGDVYFYPDDSGVIEYAEPQTLSRHADAWRLTMARPKAFPQTHTRLTGVLVSETGWGPGTGPALRIDVPLSTNRH